MREHATEQHGDLIDVSGLSLLGLDRLGDSVIEQALREILGAGQGDGEAIAGFGQA